MLVSVSQSHFRDYMLGGIILARVNSITDLGVVMDSRMSFSKHIDGTVRIRMALARLEFVNRLSDVFRDPYIRRAFYVSLVHPKLEYTSCVWWPFYDAYINNIKPVQRKFVRNSLRRLGWTGLYDLPPYA
jgi:hypothetical protein